jgi:hypothetical protein
MWLINIGSIALRAMKEGFPIHSAAVGVKQIVPRRYITLFFAASEGGR